jgi:hypothetical protein
MKDEKLSFDKFMIYFYEYRTQMNVKTYPNSAEIYKRKFRIYLGVSKSSVGGTLFSYRKLEEIFFVYGVIEQMMLYFSMLFHPYSTNILIVEFSLKPFLCET